MSNNAGVLLSDTDYQKLLVRLDVFEEAIYLTRYKDGKEPIASYLVDPTDLAAALVGIPISTGLMPSDVLFYSRRGGEIRIGVYLPPKKRTVHLAGGTSRDIPCPPLIFVGQGKRYWIWAAKGRPVDGNERLFVAPFPNVHMSSESVPDGAICQGDAEFPVCAPGTVHKAVAAFFESRFNDHLISGRSKAESGDVRKLWAALVERNARKYPLDDLVWTKHTVKSIIGGL